jgi:hypothetical protein
VLITTPASENIAGVVDTKDNIWPVNVVEQEYTR